MKVRFNRAPSRPKQDASCTNHDRKIEVIVSAAPEYRKSPCSHVVFAILLCQMSTSLFSRQACRSTFKTKSPGECSNPYTEEQTIDSPRTAACSRSFATETPIPNPQLHTSILLNRHPLLTPKPPHFAQSYYNYQYRLHRALSTPFPQHFYFKKGTALQQRFHNDEIQRDKHLLGSGFGKGKWLRLPPEPYDKPLKRLGEADVQGDVKSLDRSGDRNLYLLVRKGKEGGWRLPQAVAPKGEALHIVSFQDS